MDIIMVMANMAITMGMVNATVMAMDMENTITIVKSKKSK